LAQTYELAAVSSSALGRLEASFTAAGLADLVPADRRFSAEDSLPAPTSKPDPAVYVFACGRLGVDPAHALAIEDSVAGVGSAVAAGIPTVGNVQFVQAGEREERRAALEAAGVAAVVESWIELEAMLQPAAAGVPSTG
jgi:beta-phosphoglucomutase-like phosphatase (HAD superfamily)